MKREDFEKNLDLLSFDEIEEDDEESDGIDLDYEMKMMADFAGNDEGIWHRPC